ncbi:MAG: hypothetical protein ACTSV7_06470 [Candidatus Baldrarchaeia archaeon]
MIRRVVNLITFKLPRYCIYGITKICRSKQSEIWDKLPFKALRTPTISPDGNIIVCSFEDHLYEMEVYHNSPYATPHPPFKQEARRIEEHLERFSYKIKVTIEADFLYLLLYAM